jgi:DNA-binding MarR family transcriptional regulator
VDHEEDSTALANDPFAAMLGFHLRRTSVAVLNTLATALQPVGLNPSEATLLLWIGANRGCTQSDIGRALRAQPANLVPLLNKLTLLGALDRAAGKGRAIALSLTGAGQNLHGEVQAIFESHEARITRNLPVEKRAEMIALLRRICTDACCPDD